MRSSICAAVCFCFLLHCPVKAQCLSWPQGAARTSTKAVLTIESEKPLVRPGESAALHIQLRNATKQVLELVETFIQRDYEVHVVDSHGVEPP